MATPEFPVSSPAPARRGRLLSLIFLAAPLILYLATLSRGPFPGVSADLAARAAGLAPAPPLGHPLWVLFVQAARWIPFGTLSLRLNLISAALGALCGWLVFRLVENLPHRHPGAEGSDRSASQQAPRLAAAFAAVFFSLSMPVWILSTRAHPRMLGLALLLTVARGIQIYQATGRERLRWAVLVGLGAGAAEYPGTLWMSPLLLGWLWWAQFEHGFFRGRRALAEWILHAVLAVGVLAAGALLLLAAAAIHLPRAMAAFPEITGLWPLSVAVLRNYALEARPVAGELGWLLLAVVTLLPLCVTAPTFRRFGQNAPRGSLAVHLVAAILALMIFFDWVLSPWRLFGPAHILALPIAISAVWVGYTAETWVLLGRRLLRRRGAWSAAAGRLLSLLVPALLPVLILGALWLKTPAASGAAAAPVQRFARDAVERLSDGDWLLTDGFLNDLLRLELADRGKTAVLLNRSQDNRPAYREHLGSRLDDPRLEAAARLGVGPLLQAWMRDRTDDAARRLALLHQPGLIESAGLRVRVDAPLYRPAREADPMDDAAWQRLDNRLAAFGPENQPSGAGDKNPAAPWNQAVARLAARLANVAGVLAERQGHIEVAERAYRRALESDPDNLSARLNALNRLRARDPDGAVLAREGEALEARLRALPDTETLASIQARHGWIAHPAAALQHGARLARAGRGREAADALRGALEGRGDAAAAPLRAARARMLFAEDPAESQAVYEELLRQNPDDLESLLGLFRLAVRDERLEDADALLARLESAGADPVLVALEQASLALARSRWENAKALLVRILRQQPRNRRAWTMQAILALEIGDENLLQHTLALFEGTPEGIPRPVQYALMDQAIREEHYERAIELVGQLLKQTPLDENLLEWDLRLRAGRDDPAAARQRIKFLLTLNPRHPYANERLGLLYLQEERLKLAEACLRIASEGSPNARTLAALAYVLTLLESPEEAFALASRSVQLDPEFGPGWGALGMAALALERLADAEESLAIAESLLPGNPQVALHQARLDRAAGRRDEAIRRLDDLLAQPDLDESLRQSAAEILADIRAERP
jgi:tetratricopeptide (TPR) repeat protein